MPTLRTPWRALALVTALALTTACSTTPTTEDRVPLSQVTAATDAHALTGPSTASAHTTIDPVADRPESHLPATVVDAQGTEVTVTDTDRILALDLYGTLSRTVFELGLGDRLVGRDTSTAFPEAAGLPLVTPHGHDLNAEAILELAPTVILTDTTLGPWDVVLQMRDAGIPVVVLDSHRDIAGAGDMIRTVGDALGVGDQGEELASRTETEIATTTEQIAALAPTADEERLRIAFLYVRGSAGVYYLFGQGSGADSLIAAIGGIDVATEIGWEGMAPVNDEGIIAAQPDLLLMMTDGLESTGGVDGLLEAIPALAETDAGRNRRIVDMADSEILGFGPITADVLDALARAVYAPEPAA